MTQSTPSDGTNSLIDKLSNSNLTSKLSTRKKLRTRERGRKKKSRKLSTNIKSPKRKEDALR